VVGGHAPAALMRHTGQSNVFMTGFVSDIRPYLQDANIVVAPLFTGAGARTKVLEAWAMEKPVIGTGLAFAGLERNGDLCLATDDAQGMADRVQQLLTDRQLCHQLGVRARQTVMRGFSWDSFARFYETVYSEVLQPGFHNEFPVHEALELEGSGEQ